MIFAFFISLASFFASAAPPGKALERSYHLTVDYKTVHFTGKPQKAMAINNSIPAPSLYFRQGEKAVIHVQNKMDVETSIHWHGILLPNFEDGVPYLTSPPIRPGKTHKFEFIIKQEPGTYWYHSHTGLQEQRGLFGAFIIQGRRSLPKKELVLVLSDWTEKNPKEVLRSLKRGDEWPAIQKKALPSLWDVLMRGAFPAQLKLWEMRMHGADISDVYYPLFLINGKPRPIYENIPSGEKIRLRLINASASTYFWLSFGGRRPLLVSADGVDVLPVRPQKILHAIAETYDFIIDIPKEKSMEFKATAQDGSGGTSAIMGKGPLLKAPDIPPLDYIEEMKRITKLHKGHSHGGKAGGGDPQHQVHERKPHSTHSHSEKPHHPTHSHEESSHQSMMHGTKAGAKPHHKSPSKKSPSLKNEAPPSHKIQGKTHHHKTKKGEKPPSSGYSHLRAIKKSSFPKDMPVREIPLDLTGNMWRYVWSFNGKTLSESDKIPIKSQEITRLIFNNKTMMHHPLHLHGHFFRVLNENGDYSPWKHTVDVPPMEKVVIEFKADAPGDWFFHCHVLYHMKAGMSRVFSQGTKRDPRMKDYPASKILNGDRQWFSWGELSLLGRIVEMEGVFSNNRNRFSLDGAMSYLNYSLQFKGNFELSASYERFISDFFRLYGVGELENHKKDVLNDDIKWDVRIGFKYLLPYLIDIELSLGRRDIRLAGDYELMLFPRLHFLAEVEGTWKALDMFQRQGPVMEMEYLLGLEYRLSQYFSLMGLYDSHLGYGAGLHLKL